MCFGDVYVAAEVPTQPEQSIEQKRPALEERNDSGYVQPLPSATPASVYDEPVHATESPMSSPPASPCRRSFHRRHSSDSSKRELLRSLFSPSTLKGRLAQVLVSVVLTSTALSSCTTTSLSGDSSASAFDEHAADHSYRRPLASLYEPYHASASDFPTSYYSLSWSIHFTLSYIPLDLPPSTPSAPSNRPSKVRKPKNLQSLSANR